jgi:hypothetical protein
MHQIVRFPIQGSISARLDHFIHPGRYALFIMQFNGRKFRSKKPPGISLARDAVYTSIPFDQPSFVGGISQVVCSNIYISSMCLWQPAE